VVESARLLSVYSEKSGSRVRIPPSPPLLHGILNAILMWRDGRAVECGGLENRYVERHRGFESLSLHH
jgi:hypothetical protein